MNARTSWWIALSVAAVLFVLSRTDKGQQVVAGAADSVASSVKGYLYNNPLNVERGEQWQGLADVQDDPRFAKFVSMPYGIRAAAITLRNYQHLHGLNTVTGIINRWNPVSDGQPHSYIPNVSEYIGVAASSPLNLDDRATMFALLRGMMKQEIGSLTALLVSDDDVNEGLDLAGY